MLRNSIKVFSIKICNQNVSYGVKKIHSTPTRPVGEKSQKIDSNYGGRINELLTKYTTEQENKILEMLNSYNLEELLGYEISKGRANKIIAWRMRKGSLKNLIDIFSVESFGPQVADKFFQSLLLEPKRRKLALDKGQAKKTSFTLPSVDEQQRQLLKSCVSIRIGVNSITWCRLDVPGQAINAPCLLTHWQHLEISEKKLHLNELIQRCLYIHHLIPTADCYLFENPQMAQASTNPGSVDQQNVNIQKSQVTAVIGYALASRSSQLTVTTDNAIQKLSTSFPNIFYVRRFLAARLFNHLVGTERVSSEQTILNMMRTFYNTNEGQDFLQSQQDSPTEDVQHLITNNVNFSGRVQFPTELRQMFGKAPPSYREFLGQSLLLNLAFVRLVLLQDSESIATVSRGNKLKPII